MSGTAQERAQQAVEQQNVNKGLAIQVEDLGVKDVKAAPRPKKEKEPPKPKRCPPSCCAPRKRKEKKEKAGRTVHARSRIVMPSLSHSCMLRRLSIVSTGPAQSGLSTFSIPMPTLVVIKDVDVHLLSRLHDVYCNDDARPEHPPTPSMRSRR